LAPASGGAADLDSVPQETDDRCELPRAQLGGVATVRGRDDDLDRRCAVDGLADTVDEVGCELRIGLGHEPPSMRTRSRVG